MTWSLVVKGAAFRVIRRGPLFHRILAEMQANERKSAAQLRAYQNEQLQHTVASAVRDVPYYRALFKRLGLDAGDIGCVEDLEKLPLLRKEDVKATAGDFVSERTRWKFTGTTSGTSGSPLTVTRDYAGVNYENATLWRQFGWAGFGASDRRAWVRGDVVVPMTRTQPPFWRYSPAEKKLILSPYHLSARHLPAYVAKLRAFKPHAIQGYPSSIAQIARFLQSQGQSLAVKAVFTSSEMLLESQKEVIESHFGPIFDYYGNAERVAWIGMCEEGTYHVAPDYSIVEFLPAQQGLYEIVGTTLHNAAMPLLRYATGDLVALGDQSCRCGRAFPVVASIQGREADHIVTPSGQWIGPLNTIFHGVENIAESQIIHDAPAHLRILIVPSSDYSRADDERLTQRLRERIGPEIAVDIEKVDSIARTKQGKHKLVISTIGQESA